MARRILPPEVWQMTRAELEHRYLALQNARDIVIMIAFCMGALCGSAGLALLVGWL